MIIKKTERPETKDLNEAVFPDRKKDFSIISILNRQWDYRLTKMQGYFNVAPMNWDWDKLQEKRQKHEGSPSRQPDLKNEKPFGFDFNRFYSKFNRSGPPLIPIVLLGIFIWCAFGFFIVNPGEEGVILRFGKYNRTVGVGPHYHLPYPFESVWRVNTQMLRVVDVGVAEASVRAARPVKVAQSSMFTGDENIVHMHFTVQYSINDAAKYLFSVKDPADIIENAAEAAMREVVGNNKVESILTQGREEIQTRTLAILNTVLASYDMGVNLHNIQLGDVYPPSDVKQAFIDVASAREAKITIENQADAYRAEIVPVATGTATSIINAAKAYEQTVTKKAQGEASRFLLMAQEFSKAKDANQKRLYLEAMEEMLASQGVSKVIVSSSAQGFVPLFHFSSPQFNPGILNVSGKQIQETPDSQAKP